MTQNDWMADETLLKCRVKKGCWLRVKGFEFEIQCKLFLKFGLAKHSFYRLAKINNGKIHAQSNTSKARSLVDTARQKPIGTRNRPNEYKSKLCKGRCAEKFAHPKNGKSAGLATCPSNAN